MTKRQERQETLFSYGFVSSSGQPASKRVRSQDDASTTSEEEQGSESGSPLSVQQSGTDLGRYTEAEIACFSNEKKYWLLNSAFRPVQNAMGST